MSETPQKPPKTAALRSALIAFSPQDQLSGGPLTPEVNGARAAAALAASKEPKPSSKVPIKFPAKHEDTVILQNSRNSVKNQIRNLELSNLDTEAGKAQSSGKQVRPPVVRSSSHIAARLASTKSPSHLNVNKHSTSYPLAPANSGNASRVDRDESNPLLSFSGGLPQSSVKRRDAGGPLVKVPKRALSMSPIPVISSSSQPARAADIAAKAAATSKQEKRRSSHQTPSKLPPSPVRRHSSTSFTQSGAIFVDLEKRTSPPPPQKPDLLRPRSRSRPRKPSPAVQSPSPTRDLRTGLTTSTLADAMVASSLASSRAPSPTKASIAPPPPRPRRRSRSYSQISFRSRSRSHSLLPLQPSHHRMPSFDASTIASSSPQPPTVPVHSLRTTLRSYKASSSSEDLHQLGARHLVRKHPHKHHEGSRQRWRPTITSTERRRYEGVWAANRGHLVPKQLNQRVCNLVVRELWGRSGLGSESLADVWDLVSEESKGRPAPWQSETHNVEQYDVSRVEWRKSLGKREFVVGMWLVDQSLKGRKLPVRVGSEVWESASGVQGVTVKSLAETNGRGKKRKGIG